MANVLMQRDSLTLWIDPNLTWRALRSGKRGRQPVCSDQAIQFCLTLKVVFGLALRQTVGSATSLLKLMAKTFDRQVTKMHVRITAMNRLTALGTPVTPPVA